jgi:hypothetical protein
MPSKDSANITRFKGSTEIGINMNMCNNERDCIFTENGGVTWIMRIF